MIATLKSVFVSGSRIRLIISTGLVTRAQQRQLALGLGRTTPLEQVGICFYVYVSSRTWKITTYQGRRVSAVCKISKCQLGGRWFYPWPGRGLYFVQPSFATVDSGLIS